MADKPRKDGPHKLRPDVAEVAYRVMLEATGQAPKTVPGEGEKNPEAIARGAKGGAKGGRARAAKLSAAKKRAIAKEAATARWRRESP